MNGAYKYVTALGAVLVPAVAQAAAEGGHGGEPQLFAPPQAGLVVAVTTLIVFAVLLAVLGKFAWGPIASGLKAREDRIRKDIADAEAARHKAEAAMKEYQAQLATAEAQVRKLLADAAAQGERLATDIKMRAQSDAEETKNRANREIVAAKDQAITEIYGRAAEISTSIAEKILRRAINADDQKDLVKQSIEQLQSAGRR